MIPLLPQYRLEKRPGTSLLEVVIAMGILVMIAAGLARLSIGSYDGVRRGSDSTVAAAYAQQGLEATRAVGRQSFTALTDGSHGLSEAGGAYSFSGTSMTLGRFTRTLVIAPVQRDSFDEIVTNGGTSDPLSKNVTSTVTWTGQGGGAQIVTLSSILTNWNVARWLLSTTADFATGVYNSTVAAVVGDGAVQQKTMSSLSTPVSFLTTNPGGVSNVTATVVDSKTDRLFVATGRNASAAELFVYDTSTITATSLPLLGSIELNSTGSAIAIGGDYAYVATSDSAAEIRVIRIRDLAVTSWNITGTATIEDIAFDPVRNRLLVARVQSADQEFLVFDLSAPTTMSLVSGLDFAMDLRKISVNGNYAYIASSSTSGELQILNLATLASPTSCDIAGAQLPNALSATGTHLFFARDSGANAAFVDFVINPASPTNCPSSTNGQATISGNGNAIIPILGLNTVYVLTSVPGSGINAINLLTYAYTATDPSGNTCDSGVFFGAYLYLGCRLSATRLQVWQGGNPTSQEWIYTDSPQNSWRITNPSNLNSTGSSIYLYRTGVNSLKLNLGINGSTQFNKAFDASNAVSLDFYVNTVSPWAFSIYGATGATLAGTIAMTNTPFGSAYNSNAEEKGFTDFPTPDYVALEAAAVSDAPSNGCVLSYTTGAQTFDVTTLPTKTNPCPANSVVFIKYTTTPNAITLDFKNKNNTVYNYSFVLKNGTALNITNYTNTATIHAASSYPALISNAPIIFLKNNALKIDGIVFSQTYIRTTALTNQTLTISGSLVAGMVSSNILVRTTVNDSLNFNNTPPLGFTPNYYGQNLSAQASNGSAVLLNTYVSGGIDKDPATWQRVLIPIADFGLSSSSLTYFKIFDATGTNQPTIFIDDLRWITSVGGGSSYPLLGTYTSPAFDSAGAGTVWVRLRGRMSGSSAVEYRIRVASTQAGLVTALWTGPDGTSGTSFTSDSWQAITTDPAATGTRWIQWKATLLGDGTSTPTLQDVSLLYQ